LERGQGVKVNERILQLAERLKQAVRDTRNIETAQIQIIGLDAIKHRTGARWPELADRVRETSHNFISRRIGRHDIVVPAGDGFLVVYAEAEGAEERTLALQEKLHDFYLGKTFTQGLTVRVQHESLRAALLIERLASPARALSTSEVVPLPAEVLLRFLPVWCVAQEAITGYWIAPEHPGRKVGRFSYNPQWTETGVHRDDSNFLELDLRILEKTVSGIMNCLAQDRRCLIGFSVHSTTMLNKGRRISYLQALSQIPKQVRPYLLGRIAELQPGTPIATVAYWVHQLRPISQRMAVEIHSSQRSVAGLAEAGIFSVACVIPSARPTSAEAAAMTKMISGWSRELTRQGLKLRIDNLDDARLLGAALDARIHFCSSARLWPPTGGPEGMKLFSRMRLIDGIP
jgi:hypothetical protein